MFSYFKKPKLPITLFIIASFSALFTVLILFFAVNVHNYYMAALIPPTERYYLNNNAVADDPLVTKQFDLKSLLAGPIISPLDPSLGDGNSPITIVQFSDFKCQYCQEIESELSKVIAKYPGQIRVIWKDYPENNVQTASFQAAKAARCANEQGNFWPYHAKLFANQSKFSEAVFFQFARDLKLDLNSFTACYRGSAIENQIYDNIKEANALDINGVPFVYINNQEIMGKFTADDLDKIIKIELTKQSNAK
jgi:protein-disulfide isomerase